MNQDPPTAGIDPTPQPPVDKPGRLTVAVVLGAVGAMLCAAWFVLHPSILIDRPGGYIFAISWALLVPVASMVALIGLRGAGTRRLISAGALIGIGCVWAAARLLFAWQWSHWDVWDLTAAAGGAFIAASGILAGRALSRTDRGNNGLVRPQNE